MRTKGDLLGERARVVVVRRMVMWGVRMTRRVRKMTGGAKKMVNRGCAVGIGHVAGSGALASGFCGCQRAWRGAMGCGCRGAGDVGAYPVGV